MSRRQAVAWPPNMRETSEKYMHTMPNWNLDATSILSRRELAAVLADLKRASR